MQTSSISIERETRNGMDAVVVSRAEAREVYIAAHPPASGNPIDMFRCLARYAEEQGAHIVRQYVFGPPGLSRPAGAPLRKVFPRRDWPVTCIQHPTADPSPLTGTQLFALAGPRIERVRLDDEIVGAVFEDDLARYCMLGNIRPGDSGAPRAEQTLDVLERIERVLEGVGMDYSNVVRTWFYLDHLLDWYDVFNEVRTTYYKERGILGDGSPASTGIGASNDADTALVADVRAVVPKSGEVRIEPVPSPLQCPAPKYGSTFSRAMEEIYPTHRRLIVSGTASIEPDGRTAHVGDCEAQIALTMAVVELILTSRDMEWGDAVRAFAYFKNIEDVPLLAAHYASRGLPHFPTSISHADVCRDDLLFEIEVDAIKAV